MVWGIVYLELFSDMFFIEKKAGLNENKKADSYESDFSL